MKRHLQFLFVMILTGTFVFLPPANSAPVNLNLISPNGSIYCSISTEKNQLTLSVSINGKIVIEKSPLLMMIDGSGITNGIKTGNIKKSVLMRHTLGTGFIQLQLTGINGQKHSIGVG